MFELPNGKIVVRITRVFDDFGIKVRFEYYIIKDEPKLINTSSFFHREQR